ncbi:MAG: glutamine--tRNA ligase/YqeY domain fusion protein [Myxococcota bacterium]|nr:glutamine--tRNA ligase/YqeY domain fusion protein [Myxococcota bacterium]
MSESTRRGNFIRTIVEDDRRAGRRGGRVVTRFPPEPNGYLHIGHAKSICLNFGLAADYDGRCHLRFDDTNPAKESVEYIDAIDRDVRWLGFDWGEHLYHASGYFERLYEWAERLIEAGKAYVCELSAERIAADRGPPTRPGRESPCRDRSPAESIDLFRRMRAGEFPDGAMVLRARIDMSSSNINLRDPVMYRIRREAHPRTGASWCIYPTYDWAHGQSDAIEGITHSICTLEFEDHRPLYDWFLDQLDLPDRPRQIEFARLNLNYTVMSKRMLLELVEGGLVSGWDDPRMPTIAGLRRRGYTPESIRDFCDRIGVAKADSIVDIAMLENCVREDLNPKVPRAMCVHRPLRLVVDNRPSDRVEELDAPWFPDDPPRMGSRKVPFSRVLYIERDDFMEDPPRKFFRLAPGREVRLRWAYVVRCVGVVKDADTGEVVEVRCTCDEATRGGATPDSRKVQGTIHWVSAEHSVPVRLRLYDRLFDIPNPAASPEGFKAHLNRTSLEAIGDARIEPALGAAKAGERYQFERKGYYFVDPVDSRSAAPVFNRIVPLRDTWARIAARDGGGQAPGSRPQAAGGEREPEARGPTT